jgi:hypothetical protein
MVMDIGDRVPNLETGEGYNVSSTSKGQNPGPMTRSVYNLKRVDKFDMFGSDEFMRYGQKVRLAANPYLFKKSLCLASFKHSATVCSPSNKGIAAMVPCEDYNGVWVLDSVDPNFRMEMQGEIVKAGDPVLIRHIQTCVYLGADKDIKYKNDFGSENEVHCHNWCTSNKSQNLSLEYEGRLSSDVPTKF